MAINTDERILLNVFTGRIEIFLGRGDMQEIFRVVDSLENFKFLIKDQDGAKETLTAGTFTMTLIQDGSVKVNASAMTISGLGVGEIDFAPAAGDVDAEGVYEIQLAVTIGGVSQKVFELTKCLIREDG